MSVSLLMFTKLDKMELITDWSLCYNVLLLIITMPLENVILQGKQHLLWTIAGKHKKKRKKLVNQNWDFLLKM